MRTHEAFYLKQKKGRGRGGGGEIIKIAGEEGVMECQREQRNIR